MSRNSSPADPARTAVEGGTATPSARRVSRATWRDPRLVVGIVLVALSVLAGAQLFRSADDTVSVWATRTDLASGQTVGVGDLVQRNIRFSSAADANRYLSADTAPPRDATLLHAVGAGEMLPRSAIGATESGPVTEVPLSVPIDGVPESVRQGSVVDVWVTPEAATGRSGGASTLIFEEVAVIAAPAAGSTLAPSGTRQLIIAVAQPDEAELAEALALAARGTTVVTKRG